MNFPAKEEIVIEPVQSILKAQGSKHKGALFGIISNGGKISVDGFIIEVVADASDFRTIQIYECAKGITPKVQYFQRTKTKVVKKEVYKKPTPKTETMKVNTQVQQGELF